MNKKALGALGERIAVEMLKEKGCAILQQNYRCRHGEIDIIARDRGQIVFVEVKTRKSEKFGAPEEAVNFHKQSQLRLVACHYLARYYSTFQECRFDVYAITLSNYNEVKSVRIIENCL